MPHTRRIDADFAESVLAELYAYPRKRLWVAFALWLGSGWLGGHRFYLDRSGTGLLMLGTLGGAVLWWVVDGFLLAGMVRSHNAEQARREQLGLPPLELRFMPPLWRETLARPPEWTERWRGASRRRRAARFTGDVLVLVAAGWGLGHTARAAGVWEAVVAVFILVMLVSAGAAVGRIGHLPVVRSLLRWSHRLRLFYYYTPPGSPAALLFRPLTAPLLAPFRRRGRAEVKLYLQLGGVFTLLFLLEDFGADLILPLVTGGGWPGLGTVLGMWLKKASLNFVLIYAFATPIGAVLSLYLLMMRTHTLPRLLSLLVSAMILIGLLA
jgi:hypothetical protein